MSSVSVDEFPSFFSNKRKWIGENKTKKNLGKKQVPQKGDSCYLFRYLFRYPFRFSMMLRRIWSILSIWKLIKIGYRSCQILKQIVLLLDFWLFYKRWTIHWIFMLFIMEDQSFELWSMIHNENFGFFKKKKKNI